MDENNQECSKFQGVLLSVVKSKLNLMLSETSQLFQGNQKIDISNNQVLVKTILKKIANKEIKSVHISPEEADSFINIFDEMESHTEQRQNSFNGDEDIESEDTNIYSDSPFK